MTGRPTILLVDDDVDTREMYCWSLEARGFEVLGAGSVAQAATIAAERRPVAIITDFTLPGADGFDLAARIRESVQLRDLPMVLVSGRAFVGGSGERALALFDRVLLKPVLPDQLLDELVPLLLDRTTALLKRQLGDVRRHLSRIPRGSAVSQVLDAVDDVAGDSGTAAFLANSAAHYIGVNDAACALTGRSRAELLTLSVWDLTPEIGIADGQLRWAEFVRAGSLTGAYRLHAPSGAPIEASFAAWANVLPGCHLSLLQPLPPALT